MQVLRPILKQAGLNRVPVRVFRNAVEDALDWSFNGDELLNLHYDGVHLLLIYHVVLNVYLSQGSDMSCINTTLSSLSPSNCDLASYFRMASVPLETTS